MANRNGEDGLNLITALLVGLVALLVILGALFIFYRGSSVPAPQTENPSTSALPPSSTGGASSSSSPVNTAQTIVYSDSGFSPSNLSIKKGATVTFENRASDPMRPASNPHPLHNGYPTTGGCVSSTFDACASIAPGSSWSFIFNIAGTWGYHNHLNPAERGTVTVTP